MADNLLDRGRSLREEIVPWPAKQSSTQDSLAGEVSRRWVCGVSAYHKAIPMRLLSLVLSLALGASVASAADNTLGTWKRNIEKSTTNRPSRNPYTSLITVRQAVPGGVRVNVTSVRKDGTRAEFGYTARYDGTPTELSSSEGPFNMLSVMQIDENTLVIENWSTKSGYRTKSKSVISSHGKTMTNTRNGVDDKGNEIRDTILYEKQ
jgi:hypothetical protein